MPNQVGTRSKLLDEYVCWYSWAWTNLVREVMVCHTAAAAAMLAIATGGDRDAAAAAACRAAGDDAAVGRTRAGYGPLHRHVEWLSRGGPRRLGPHE